ncbi:MAG: hypothetical protein ACJ8M1_07795 [Chthoniobacterales bacterium]
MNRFFGPRKHYDHFVTDGLGRVTETYVYYLDEQGKPVLDGDRIIYKSENDDGTLLSYRDGTLVGRSNIVIRP